MSYSLKISYYLWVRRNLQYDIWYFVQQIKIQFIFWGLGSLLLCWLQITLASWAECWKHLPENSPVLTLRLCLRRSRNFDVSSVKENHYFFYCCCCFHVIDFNFSKIYSNSMIWCDCCSSVSALSDGHSTHTSELCPAHSHAPNPKPIRNPKNKVLGFWSCED